MTNECFCQMLGSIRAPTPHGGPAGMPREEPVKPVKPVKPAISKKRYNTHIFKKLQDF